MVSKTNKKVLDMLAAAAAAVATCPLGRHSTCWCCRCLLPAHLAAFEPYDHVLLRVVIVGEVLAAVVSPKGHGMVRVPSAHGRHNSTPCSHHTAATATALVTCHAAAAAAVDLTSWAGLGLHLFMLLLLKHCTQLLLLPGNLLQQ